MENTSSRKILFLKLLIILALYAEPVVSSSVTVEERILKIPALGRIFNLGSLYNARTDSFTDMDIFKSSLPGHLIATKNVPRIHTESQIIRKESDKIKIFGLDLDTAASIQTGIVQPEGAASVLTEDVTKGVTGIFLQTFQTAEQTLPIFHEELRNYYNMDFEFYSDATHIITGVSWGGSIAVKFTDIDAPITTSKRSSVQQSSNILEQEFKKLRRKSGHFDSQPSSFEMHLTSDVPLQNELPTTLREVRGEINHVRDSIKNINTGLGVPLKFTLTPISIFKKYLNVATETENAAHKLDQTILQEYLNIIDDIQTMEKKLLNIEKNLNCVPNELHRDIEELHRNFYMTGQNFQVQFKNIQLRVKSGALNNSALLQVLQNYESQDFNHKNVRATLIRNEQALQKVGFCSQLNELYPEIQYFGSASNLISKIYANHNKPTYVLFTKSEFTENDQVSYEDNLNIFLNILYKPSNALFIVDCDFSYAQCESVNGTAIKQIRHGNYTFNDVRMEMTITEMENKTEIVRCNKESGITGALCVSAVEKKSAKLKTNKVLSRNQKYPEESQRSRIVGGNTANPNEFPFQVLFLNSQKVSCGGTILDKNFILTAAHCLYDYDEEEYKSLTIVAGDHNWQKDEGTEQRRQIQDVHIHQKYIPIAAVNDIAIVQLDRPFELSRAVQPILLPDADYEATGDAIVTGWGKLRYGGSTSLVLQKVAVPIVSRADCVAAYEEAQVFVSAKMLCAGDLDVGGLDACQGDSGGPLSVKLRNVSSMLVGVVSSGIGCGWEGYPGIYMQVSKYVDWINDTLSNFEALSSRVPTPTATTLTTTTPQASTPINLHRNLECGGRIPMYATGETKLIGYKYNQRYCNNAQCLWSLNNEVSYIRYKQTIKIKLLRHGFAESQDWLYALKFNRDTGLVSQKIEYGQEYTFSEDQLYLSFTSDPTITGYGFAFQLTVIDSVEKGRGWTSYWTSWPGDSYWGAYASNDLLNTVINPKTDISFEVNYVRTRGHNTCDYGRLMVWEIKPMGVIAEKARLCGNITSTSSSFRTTNPILAVLTADGSNAGPPNSGFKVTWS